jgi:hypothetical protein
VTSHNPIKTNNNLNPPQPPSAPHDSASKRFKGIVSGVIMGSIVWVIIAIFVKIIWP